MIGGDVTRKASAADIEALGKPEIMFRWSRRSVGTEGSIGAAVNGEEVSDRPGSRNRAKVKDGSPGSLRSSHIAAPECSRLPHVRWSRTMGVGRFALG